MGQTETAEPLLPARRAFREAARELLEQPSTAFRTEIDFLGVSMTTEGEYEYSAERMQSTVTVRSPEGDLAFEYLGVRDDLWFRFVETGFIEDATCWIEPGTDGLDAMLGSLTPEQATRGVPAAALAVGYGRGEKWIVPQQVLEGTSDLYLVAASAGRFATTLGLDPGATDRVTVDFLLDDGEIVGWTSRLGDLIDAAERAGASLPAEVAQQRTAIENIELRATLERRAAVQIEPPDPREIIEVDVARAQDPAYQDDLDAELAACEAR